MNFDTLVSAGRARSSGELVVAGTDVEAHLYLWRGRLAWAMSSLPGVPFVRRLCELGVDRTALADVIHTCRRTKAQLETTLVQWGVASALQVRDAQLAQICESLATLHGTERVETVFLPKDLVYSSDRTFSIEEVAAACTGPLAQVREAIHDAFERVGRETNTDLNRRFDMANAKETLPKLMEIDGCMGACIVDSDSGMMLGAVGGGVDLELAAAGNTEVVRAKRKTMYSLQLNEQIEDILITLGRQYHVIRPLASNDALFIYLVLDKSKANLAMARHQLRAVEADLVI